MTCILCRFDTELDDVVVMRGERHCICVRCFARETESTRRMPKTLQQELIALLADTAPSAAPFPW